MQGFERATGVKVNWTYAPRREGDIEQVWGNVDKANRVLGWKADTPLSSFYPKRQMTSCVQASELMTSCGVVSLLNI